MTRYLLDVIGRRLACLVRGHDWRRHAFGRICARCYVERG